MEAGSSHQTPFGSCVPPLTGPGSDPDAAATLVANLDPNRRTREGAGRAAALRGSLLIAFDDGGVAPLAKGVCKRLAGRVADWISCIALFLNNREGLRYERYKRS